MKNIATSVGLIVGIAILAGVAAAAQGRGRGNGPSQTPPGQERKANKVPEPALTLLGVAAVGGGLLARRWTSRRKKSQSSCIDGTRLKVSLRVWQCVQRRPLRSASVGVAHWSHPIGVGLRAGLHSSLR